jgi:hypothetical protein
MKKSTLLTVLLLSTVMTVEAFGQTSVYKKRKQFGPIPANGVSIFVGYVDGPDHEYLSEHLNNWAEQRNGYEGWDDWSTSFYSKLQYQRQISPNHFFTSSLNFSYLNAKGTGDFVSQTDPPVSLMSERTLKIYFISIDLGFHYYMVKPEVRKIAPYIGGGFSGVFPIERLDSTFMDAAGNRYESSNENVSEESFEVGIHGEFGLLYYISNRYSAGLEGRYQKAQSKFVIHGGNFDIDYSGLSLSLMFHYYF